MGALVANVVALEEEVARLRAVRVNRTCEVGDWLCAQGNPHPTKADAEACSGDYEIPEPDHGF